MEVFLEEVANTHREEERTKTSIAIKVVFCLVLIALFFYEKNSVMKFSRKSNKRSFDQSRKKKFRLSFIKYLTWPKKKDIANVPLPNIGELENEHLKLNSRYNRSNLTSNKCLEKSHSSPLPMNTNQSLINDNRIQSAHIIHQYADENRNPVSVYSCVSEVGDNQSTESISSDEESVEQSHLLQYNKNKNLRHRWSFLDIWNTTVAKLPPILNRIRRKRLRLTGSREFRESSIDLVRFIVLSVLEYDQLLPTNNNHSNNSTQEQRYVEQERPIHSHIGLALLALLVFPPVGK